MARLSPDWLLPFQDTVGCETGEGEQERQDNDQPKQQKSMAFIADTTAVIETFPRGYGYLSDQLGRASLSIATNLAEGNGRFTKPDRRHFFTIARGSVQECVPLLDLAVYFPENRVQITGHESTPRRHWWPDVHTPREPRRQLPYPPRGHAR